MKNLYLLPRAPKLDKVAALFIRSTYVQNDAPLETVKILFHDGRPIPAGTIDIDALVDYKTLGVGSATEAVAKEFPEIMQIPGMTYFISVFNHNNRTGNLKNKFADSFFGLINDWPRVPHNVARDEHFGRIIAKMFVVFEAYFAVAGLVKSIDQIRNPFCQDGLGQMLQILRRSPNQALWRRASEAYSDIEDMFEATERADQRTVEAAKRIQPELTFTVNTADGQPLPAAIFRTDDKRIIRRIWALNPELVLVVMRDRRGHYGIFTKGSQELGALYVALNASEPGCWYHEERYRSPFVLNSSESRDVQPSQLTPSQVRDLIVKNVMYVSRTQAAQA